MEDRPADDLHVVVAHVFGAPRGIPAGGERLRHQVVERFPGFEPRAVFDAQSLEFLVRQGFHLIFEGIGAFEDAPRQNRVLGGVLRADVTDGFHGAVVGGAEEPADEPEAAFDETGEGIAELIPDAGFHRRVGRHGQIASMREPFANSQSKTGRKRGQYDPPTESAQPAQPKRDGMGGETRRWGS